MYVIASLFALFFICLGFLLGMAFTIIQGVIKSGGREPKG